MKVKCINNDCETLYDISFNGKCPKCGSRGGYAQEPKLKAYGEFKVHLEEQLRHKPSKNIYQAKELQVEGIIAVVKFSAIPSLIGSRVYISKSMLNEYEVVL